ncbi:hypothetical protein [Vibrio phage vB_VpaP_SJSY21]|nr:hypothetical protein [Vibrio phage vB_VpaP_SJSY21]
MFKELLYKATAEHYDLPLEVAVEHFTDRELKDVNTILFEGLTPRGALIHVSEDIIKPKYGKGYFGKKLSTVAKDLYNSGEKIVVVTDGGFKEEAIEVSEALSDVHIKIVHLSRPDCSFEGDSRDYIELTRDNVTTYSLALEEGNIELGLTGLCKIIKD